VKTMNRDNINRAVLEAQRFLDAVERLPEPEPYDRHGSTIMRDYYPKQQGAIRRASMDLTRALAEMRKPG
jgi:hypothetical protein